MVGIWLVICFSGYCVISAPEVFQRPLSQNPSSVQFGSFNPGSGGGMKHRPTVMKVCHYLWRNTKFSDDAIMDFASSVCSYHHHHHPASPLPAKLRSHFSSFWCNVPYGLGAYLGSRRCQLYFDAKLCTAIKCLTLMKCLIFPCRFQKGQVRRLLTLMSWFLSR